MARYTKQSVSSIAGINSELTKIQTAISDSLSRKGDTPNQMEGTLDMNSNRVINLPDPVSDREPITFGLAKVYTDRAEAAAEEAESFAQEAASSADIATQYPEGQLAAALSEGSAIIAGQSAEELSNLTNAITRGLKITPIYFILRATEAGAWEVLNDEGHIPLGVASVVTNEIGQIGVVFDKPYGKVLSFVVGVDETLSKAGFIAGASVGLSSASITVAAPCQVRVNMLDGTLTKEPWVTASSTITPTGIVVVTHPTRATVGANHNLPSVSVYNQSNNTITADWNVSWTGTTTVIAPVVPLAGYVSYNGSSWVISSECAGLSAVNIEDFGVAITHPSTIIPFSSTPQVSSGFGPLIAQHGSFSNTSFQVKFKDFTGTTAAAYSTNMKFSFLRDVKVNTAAPISGTAIVDLGYLPIDAREFSSSIGNFWCVAYMLDGG